MKHLQHTFGDDASYFRNRITNFIFESKLPKEIEKFEKSVGYSIKDFYKNKIGFKEIKHIDALFKRNAKALFAKSKMDIHNNFFKILSDCRADNGVDEVIEYAKGAKKRLQENGRAKSYLNNKIPFHFAENGRFSTEENIEGLCNLSIKTMVSGKQFVGEDVWIPHTTSIDSLVRQFSSSGIAVVWHQKISVLMDFLNQPEVFLKKGLLKRPDFLLYSGYYKERLAIITTNIEDKYNGKFFEIQWISEYDKLEIWECIDSYVYSFMDEKLLQAKKVLESNINGLYWKEDDLKMRLNELEGELNSTSNFSLRPIVETSISFSKLKNRFADTLYDTFLSGEGFVNERMIIKGVSPNKVINNFISSQLTAIGLRVELEALKFKLSELNKNPKRQIVSPVLGNKLRLRQIALKHVYLNQHITKENANEIVINYGFSSAQKLLDLYNFYSSRANRKAKPNPFSSKKLDNKIKLFESVEEMLPVSHKEKILDEIKILISHQNDSN